MALTYTKPNPKTHKRRDYDSQILSQADYQALQGYQNDYRNAATDEQRQQAHQAAEDLRARYGYSMGADGTSFTPSSTRPGVSEETNIHLLQLQNGPDWSQDYDAQYTQLLSQLENRAFSYDPSDDPLYQNYSTLYQGQGQQAMRDTVAQNAALTGGYASSWATSAGQQAYQSQLDQLAAQLPSLYQLALDRYNAEGSDLRQQLQLLSQQQQNEAQNYQQQLDYWQNLAQQEQENYWNQAQQSQQYMQATASSQSQAQQHAWQQAMDSINLGVVPSAAVLQAAGISTAWAQAMANTARYRIYS